MPVPGSDDPGSKYREPLDGLVDRLPKSVAGGGHAVLNPGMSLRISRGVLLLARGFLGFPS